MSQFEWFCGYDMLGPFAHEFLEPVFVEASATPRLLVAGCGNSRLGCDLYDDFAEDVDGEPRLDIWNVDYAPAAVAASSALAGKRQMRHVVGDLMALPRDKFDAGSFDAVVDKGTLDALFCAGDDAPVAAARELRRVLRAGGRALVVSGVATSDQVLAAFSDWTVLLDGSPYITDDGEATINLDAALYVFQKPGD